MAPDVEPLLTAQQRLAISRRALLNQLQGRTQPVAAAAGSRVSFLDRFADRFAWGSLARKLAQRWWRRHPANAAGQLARPLIERYAREQPFKLVAVAAAVGAAALVIKPWRLLSVTAVLAALMKNSDVADVVTSLLQKKSGSGSTGNSPAAR